jgi:4-amino-4-deoxy-L-arabinose transferase-like glycosyltransferase
MKTGTGKRLIIELVFFFVLAALPRLWRLPADLQITYDQGMHSLAVWNIWHDGELSLLGHPTDVQGIFHAPVYYWLMLPFYVLSHGDPAGPAVWQAIINSFAVILVYLLARRLFNRRTATISAFIFALSFGYAGFARWLSNVGPVMPFSLVFFICLERIFKNKFQYLPVAALVCSLIVEFNGAIGVFLIPLLALTLVIKPKYIWVSLLAFVLPHLPLILFDLRHNFLVTHSILNYSFAHSTGLGLNLATVKTDILTLLDQLYSASSRDAFPLTILLIILTGVVTVKYFFRSAVKLILLFILIPVLGLFLYHRTALGFFYWSILPLFTILISFAISKLRRRYVLIVISLIALINSIHLITFLQPAFALTPMGTRNLITNQDRKNIVDWIYHSAGSRPIYLWSYTIPYLLNEPWDYYFIWYGNAKYHRLPESFGGLNRIDIPPSGAVFIIYEPDYLNSFHQQTWYQRVNSEFPALLDSFRSHDAIVEYRQ